MFRFQNNDPGGSFESIMVQEIEQHDNLLFIASENSIKSRACQFELTQGRKKSQAEWRQVVVPVRLDDYIITIRESDIPANDKRKEYWDNIQDLKRTNIHDFSTFVNEDVSPAFESEIDKLEEQYLIKN